MALVTSKEMLTKARKGGYAVGAFNAENMEMVKAIIAAAEELKAPVMIQTTPSTVKYGTKQKLRKQAYRYACTWITAAVMNLQKNVSEMDIHLL